MRKGSFDELFRSLREKVMALCLHIAGSRVDAEDAFQETFLAVYRSLPEFRGEASASTWVYRIAVRAALRARARRRGEPLETAPVSGTDPEGALEARDDVRRLLERIEALPSEQKTVLLLFAVEGLSHGEIADILEVPEGTIWSRVHAARKRLTASGIGRAEGPPK